MPGRYCRYEVQEQLLWDAAELTQQQGWDWDAYYDRTGVGRTGANAGKPMPKFAVKNVGSWTMWDHGVNNAMATKYSTIFVPFLSVFLHVVVLFW